MVQNDSPAKGGSDEPLKTPPGSAPDLTAPPALSLSLSLSHLRFFILYFPVCDGVILVLPLWCPGYVDGLCGYSKRVPQNWRPGPL